MCEHDGFCRLDVIRDVTASHIHVLQNSSLHDHPTVTHCVNYWPRDGLPWYSRAAPLQLIVSCFTLDAQTVSWASDCASQKTHCVLIIKTISSVSDRALFRAASVEALAAVTWRPRSALVRELWQLEWDSVKDIMWPVGRCNAEYITKWTKITGCPE